MNSSWIEKVAVPETEEMLSYTMDQENENPERMFHISRKVVNYWDISEDLGEVIRAGCWKRIGNISDR